MGQIFDALRAEIATVAVANPLGRVAEVARGTVMLRDGQGNGEKVRAGEEGRLAPGKPVAVFPSPTLAEGFAWSDRVRRGKDTPKDEGGAEPLRGLGELKARNIPAGILSNGDPEMLGVAVKSAGFSGLLTHVLSVHALRKFKTDPAAYALGPQALNLPAKDILFVSSNGWDAIGATWYGYTTLWVNRFSLPLEQLDTQPTRTGTSLRDVLDCFPT